MKGLGSTAAQHRKALAASEAETERLVERVEVATKAGDCVGAFNRMAQAASSFGATVVHNKVVHGDVSGLNMLNNRYWAARDKFRDQCVIPRGELRGRGRARRSR